MGNGKGRRLIATSRRPLIVTLFVAGGILTAGADVLYYIAGQQWLFPLEYVVSVLFVVGMAAAFVSEREG